MGAFFQELAPELKVTVDENSERHSMTTTYIHKLNLGVYMTYTQKKKFSQYLCFLIKSTILDISLSNYIYI